MLGFLKNIVGETSAKEVKRLTKIVNKINSLEEEIAALSDEQLKEKTAYFKELLENGKTLDDIKEEAFAVIREASKRVLNMRPYDVQLMGGLVLHKGNIAEMQTGEGKTLVASLPSYLRALEGKGVHVITVNEYLAKRDFETIGQIHQFLGLTVGLNISQMSPADKQAAYNADITYGTGNEFGFDYLRDHMVQNSSEKVQRPLHYAIIDEIDSILIDEARTPLIIANKSDLSSELFKITSKVVRAFKKDVDYTLYSESKQLSLTYKGARKVERAFGIRNIYDLEHQLLLHFVMQSLRAEVIMRKDVDYIVKDDEILLVDLFTGRIMEGRTYSDGLQQAIEAKEGVSIKEENVTMATITIQNYFRMYTLLAGMTGSAASERQEFLSTYNLDVVEIPTNQPRVRIDHEDLVYVTKADKYKKIAAEVEKLNQIGRPVLIGTTSIQQSEELSDVLKEIKIEHQVLNAKTVEEEADIISEAGQMGRVMIATNMAGRGTDILLGEGVHELGGLHIIGTEKHESRRIDKQLRGRAGRQGDPGSTQFILSLEDALLEVYDQEEIEEWKEKVKTDQDGLITSPDPRKFIEKVQFTIENVHYSSREHILKLDDVFNEQRKVIYSLRNKLLDIEGMHPLITDYLQSQKDFLIAHYCPEEAIIEEMDIDTLYDELKVLFPLVAFDKNSIRGLELEEIKELIQSDFDAYVTELETYFTPEIESQLKMILLQIIDRQWIFHLENMNQLKEGIHLRSYGQESPYRIFEIEAFQMYDEFKRQIELQTCKYLLSIFNRSMKMREETPNVL